MLKSIIARLIQAGTSLRLRGLKPIKVACIANFRDEFDVSNFGYQCIDDAPAFLPWIGYRWEGVVGQLIMIGSLTNQLTGNASDADKEKGRQQFIEATEYAVSRGAEVVLFAAAGTKRLFRSGELEKIFPGVTFGLGDNFTAYIIIKQIEMAVQNSGLVRRFTKVVVTSPTGLLGSIAANACVQMGMQVYGLSREKYRSQTEALASKIEASGMKGNFTPIYSWEDAKGIDMVVACSSNPLQKVTEPVLDWVGKPGRKMLLIDPNEPPAMSKREYRQLAHRVLRLEAGNGYSRNLKYILGYPSWKVLRMCRRETWGCFCETFLLAKNEELKGQANWFDICPENIRKVAPYLGDGPGLFDISRPRCFNRQVTNFDLEAETRRSLGLKRLGQLRWAEGFRLLL